MTREVLALGPFLTDLEQRLDELPAEQLRRILLEHGARLSPGERADFLRIFDPATTADAAAGHDDPELREHGDPIPVPSAIDAFTVVAA